ncbi:hypothetical protein HMI55_007278 [Coelomomyces lativittatus]|nr:hypothetical protein HMI55_007278 [Coelomomyces lativittatus]
MNSTPSQIYVSMYWNAFFHSLLCSFSISPINSNDNTYTLTQEHHGQTWTIIKEFHWSHLTFHTQGVLITAPTSSFYSLPDPLPMSHGVLVPPPSPSPSSTTSTGLTTTTTASTVTTTTTTTTSETMTPTLSSGSFPSSSLSLASGLRDAKKTIVIHVAWVWLASTFRNTS